MKVKCKATSSRTGEPCGRYPIAGADICPSHGGRAKAVKAKAAVRVAEARARAAVAKMDCEPVSNPLAALAEVAGELIAVKDWLRGRVDLIEADKMRTPDAKGGEQMRAEFQAYTAALNSCVTALATIARLNLDERLAAITEAQVAMIMEALRRALAESGLAGEAHANGLRAVGRHLRVLNGGQAEVSKAHALTSGGESL